MSNTLIPVEISLFNSSISGNRIILNWTTATEVNNSGFDIERKLENLAWVKISHLIGKGTTTEKTKYQYIDVLKELSYKGIIKYRLRQIDYDGTSSYI